MTRSSVSSEIKTRNLNSLPLLPTLNINIINANILDNTITVVYFIYKLNFITLSDRIMLLKLV